MRLLPISFCAVLAIAAFPAMSRADHSKPFKGNLTVTATNTTVTEDGFLHIVGTIEGHGTILGRITGSFDYFVNPTNGNFAGVITKVAANGDEVHEVFAGDFNDDFTASTGVFSIQGGTGRFQNAEGGGFFTGTVVSATTIDVNYLAVIDVPK